MNYASLKYDDVFREVFSRESIRRQFISDVTGIALESIRSVRLASPFLWKRSRRQKQGILDVALVLNDDTRIDIELQIRFQKFWDRRSLFYFAKLYTEDLRVGERYDRLRKCIVINILDFQMFSCEEYHSVYTLRDRSGRMLTDLFEIHVIELTKDLKGMAAVNDWIRLFNAETLEEMNMISTKNAGILEAMEVMRSMSLGKRLRLIYEAHLKERRDRWAQDEYVKDLGRMEGRAEGLLALINTLKEYCPDSDAIYAKVIRNPIYADLSRDEFEKYL